MVNRNLIKQIDLAAMAGVSRAAVNKALVNQLAQAAVGQYVDLDNSLVQKWLQKHARRRRKQSGLADPPPEPKTIEAPKAPKKRAAVGTAKGPESREINKAIAAGRHDEMATLDDNIQKLAHRSLSDLVEIFGSNKSFEGWLTSLNKLEKLTQTRIANEKALGNWVSLDLVQRAFVSPVESCHLMLLSDGLQTMSVQIHARMQSGCEALEIEEYMRGYVSKYIKNCKADIERAIDDAERNRRESSITRDS